MLSEKQAWSVLRDEFGIKEETVYNQAGLCHGADRLMCNNLIDETTWRNMRRAIKQFAPVGFSLWFWPLTPAGNLQRVLAIDSILKSL